MHISLLVFKFRIMNRYVGSILTVCIGLVLSACLSFGDLDQETAPLVICTCAFEKNVAPTTFPKEKTRYIYIVRRTEINPCCTADPLKEYNAYKETHHIESQACPVWGREKIDTIPPEQAQQMSCELPDGVFALYPTGEENKTQSPFVRSWYPELEQ